MTEARIVERTGVDDSITYVIQQRHFLIRWLWVDAWINQGVEITDSYKTLEEARKNLCYYDGSEPTDKVVA